MRRMSHEERERLSRETEPEEGKKKAKYKPTRFVTWFARIWCISNFFIYIPAILGGPKGIIIVHRILRRMGILMGRGVEWFHYFLQKKIPRYGLIVEIAFYAALYGGLHLAAVAGTR